MGYSSWGRRDTTAHKRQVPRHAGFPRGWGFSHEARRGSQGACRAVPGKSGLRARGEGERIMALESWETARSSRGVEEGLSRSFSGCGGKPSFPSTSAGDTGQMRETRTPVVAISLSGSRRSFSLTVGRGDRCQRGGTGVPAGPGLSSGFPQRTEMLGRAAANSSVPPLQRVHMASPSHPPPPVMGHMSELQGPGL